MDSYSGPIHSLHVKMGESGMQGHVNISECKITGGHGSIYVRWTAHFLFWSVIMS